MRIAKWIFRNIEEVISSLFFIIMCFSVALGVFTRFFELSFVWTDELARYAFIWSVLLGTVVVFKHKKHITIDLIGNMFPTKGLLAIHALIHIGLLVLFFILVKYGWMLTLQTWNVPTTSLQIPTGLVYLAVPLASFLLIIYSCMEIYRTARKMLSSNPA